MTLGVSTHKILIVLLSDVNEAILKDEISDLGGIPYLQEASKKEAEKVRNGECDAMQS